jgi:hypothetical protein
MGRPRKIRYEEEYDEAEEEEEFKEDDMEEGSSKRMKVEETGDEESDGEVDEEGDKKVTKDGYLLGMINFLFIVRTDLIVQVEENIDFKHSHFQDIQLDSTFFL